MNVSTDNTDTSKKSFPSSASEEVPDRAQEETPLLGEKKPSSSSSTSNETEIKKPNKPARDSPPPPANHCDNTTKEIPDSLKQHHKSSKDDLKEKATDVAAPGEGNKTTERDVNSVKENPPIDEQKLEMEKSTDVAVANTSSASNKNVGAAVSLTGTAADGEADIIADETVVEPKKRTRKRWKKPPGKPNRPLSAYNLYFRKERAVMLGDAVGKDDHEQGKKRVHRKTHGKIGFAEMARIIGSRWKALPEEHKEQFVEVAAGEKVRYAKELAQWREEQKKKTIGNSIGPGCKSSTGKESSSSKTCDENDGNDDLVKSIAKDREELIRQHQAFRMQMGMQMMQEMHGVGPPFSRLTFSGIGGEGYGRQMPTIDYLRTMQEERTASFIARNRMGGTSSLPSHYPNAAERSARDLLQSMSAMGSASGSFGSGINTGSDGPGRSDSNQLQQLQLAHMQMMNPPTIDGSMGGPMGGSMGTVGQAQTGGFGNIANNSSFGAASSNNGGNLFGGNVANATSGLFGNNPTQTTGDFGGSGASNTAYGGGGFGGNTQSASGSGNIMGNNTMGTMGSPMGNNSLASSTMGAPMGMTPINNESPQKMSASSQSQQLELERLQQMRYQSQMYGMNNNQMQSGGNSADSMALGISDNMISQEGSNNDNIFHQQNRFNDGDMQQ